MRIKQKNLKQLASLSALGAGALGVGAGTAQATMITVDVNQIFTPQQATTSHSYGPATGFIPIASFGDGIGFGAHVWAGAIDGPSVQGFGVGLRARTNSNYANGGFFFGAGEVSSGNKSLFGSLRSGFPGVNLASHRTWFYRGLPSYGSHSPTSGTNGNGGLPPAYRQFAFMSTSGQEVHGWVEYEVLENFMGGIDAYKSGPCTAPVCLPSVEVIAYATEEQSSTPEPASASLMAFGALALGALGMRRWRAARQPAA